MKCSWIRTLHIIWIMGVFCGCFTSKQPPPTKQDSFLDSSTKFGPAINQFELQVPLNYNHATQIKRFMEKYDSTFIFSPYYNIDSCFKNATSDLIPGQKYLVGFYSILKKVSSEECLAFLKSQNCVLVNAHGLTLAWEYGQKHFPKQGGWVLSFDEENNLLKEPYVKYVYRYIPMIGHYNLKENLSELGYYSFIGLWDPGFACLLSFKLKPETTR